MPARLKTLRVLARPGQRARGWLIAGPLRFACALGPAGIVRDKREGDGGTPAGRFRLLWGYYRPDRPRPPAGGVALRRCAAIPAGARIPRARATIAPCACPPRIARIGMWREDALYDLTFVLDQNFTRRCKGSGSAIFFHLARPGLTPTAGCVAISAADMRKLAPRLARGAAMRIG